MNLKVRCTNSHQVFLTYLIGASLFIVGPCIPSLPDIAQAEEPTHPDRPPVFLPNETQHGFAEFDSVPDFFSDETPAPAPYDSYSDSPLLPSSDQKPGGLFQSLEFAEDVDEDRTIRRGHIHIAVNPSQTFPQTIKSVYLVFSVFKHLASYQIIGRLFYEADNSSTSTQLLDEDIADLATEDESGFLKFFPPEETWKPGTYRVDVYVGYMANQINKMGAVRFTIIP